MVISTVCLINDLTCIEFWTFSENRIVILEKKSFNLKNYCFNRTKAKTKASNSFLAVYLKRRQLENKMSSMSECLCHDNFENNTPVWSVLNKRGLAAAILEDEYPSDREDLWRVSERCHRRQFVSYKRDVSVLCKENVCRRLKEFFINNLIWHCLLYFQSTGERNFQCLLNIGPRTRTTIAFMPGGALF